MQTYNITTKYLGLDSFRMQVMRITRTHMLLWFNTFEVISILLRKNYLNL